MKAAIFDLDDTLYERDQFVLSGFAAVADELERRFSLPAPWILATLKRARMRGHEGRELQVLCADHGLPESIIPELVEVIRRHEPALTLGSVASAVIAQLRADGWRVAILTNGLPATQRAKVEALGLEARVDAVLYAEEHAPGGKPSSAAFDAALSAVAVPAGQAVFIGDDLVRDIHGARAAGMFTIRVAARAARRAEGDADAIVMLEDVPAAARRLVKGSGAHAA
ncbi:MAG TPA: HAD family hydrolase [Vicinamibacterales bacterium]|jgi:putative hydrolase of the HAD superfamily|nr:HAD family hydrolase [Vicinamibacterales bacterium]